MNLLDKITTLASKARELDDYRLADTLTKIATDVALVETNRYFVKQFKVAQAEIAEMKKQFSEAHLHKFAQELDAIARDLESRVIVFEMEDPIEAVLDSYKLLHKIARTQQEPSSTMSDILELAESNLPDNELIEQIRKQTLGLSLNDKMTIIYILEKDYNLSIPLEKIAKLDVRDDEFIRNPQSEEDHKHNKKALKKILKEYKSLPEDEQDKFKLPASFPSEPYIWSGFAYESSIPYQQSSQLNFWSLASRQEEEILNKIAKRRK